MRQNHQYLLFTSWPSVWVSCVDKRKAALDKLSDKSLFHQLWHACIIAHPLWDYGQHEVDSLPQPWVVDSRTILILKKCTFTCHHNTSTPIITLNSLPSPAHCSPFPPTANTKYFTHLHRCPAHYDQDALFLRVIEQMISSIYHHHKLLITW